MSEHHPREVPEGGDIAYGDFERSKQRATLFRVIAANLVRELRSSGHHGTDLVAFVNAVVTAVNEEGFDGSGPPDRPRGSESFDEIAGEVRIDEEGRASIVGSRVVLRPPTESDGAALARWMSDPLVRASLAPAVLSEITAQLSGRAAPTPNDRVDMVICSRETGVSLGVTSLFRIDRKVGQAEIVKVIGEPSVRGQGFAAAGARLILAYGFRSLGLNRIYLRTLGGNVRNIRLNEHIGFRFEGVLREAVIRDGTPTDVVLMAMLCSEFEQRCRHHEPLSTAPDTGMHPSNGQSQGPS